MSPLALVPVDSALGVVVAAAALLYSLPMLVRAAVRQHRRDAARVPVEPPTVARHVARYRP